MFLVVGIIAGLGTLIQTYCFAGVKMTSRLRKTAFGTLLKQEVAYFDDEKNSVGALCSRLAGDCSNVQGVSKSRANKTLINILVVKSIGHWSTHWYYCASHINFACGHDSSLYILLELDLTYPGHGAICLLFNLFGSKNYGIKCLKRKGSH